MSGFYQNRADEFEDFLTTMVESLKTINRSELQPLSLLVEQITRLRESDPLTAVKLTPLMRQELPALTWSSLHAKGLGAYGAMQEDIAAFIDFELPTWLWRPELKSAATEVITTAWHLSADDYFDSIACRELEDRYEDLILTVDDKGDELKLFSDVLAQYEQYTDKHGFGDRLRNFQEASNRFTVAALLTEVA